MRRTKTQGKNPNIAAEPFFLHDEGRPSYQHNDTRTNKQASDQQFLRRIDWYGGRESEAGRQERQVGSACRKVAIAMMMTALLGCRRRSRRPAYAADPLFRLLFFPLTLLIQQQHFLLPVAAAVVVVSQQQQLGMAAAVAVEMGEEGSGERGRETMRGKKKRARALSSLPLFPPFSPFPPCLLKASRFSSRLIRGPLEVSDSSGHGRQQQRRRQCIENDYGKHQWLLPSYSSSPPPRLNALPLLIIGPRRGRRTKDNIGLAGREEG